MAKLIFGDKEHELPNGASIAEICEQEGVPFNCNTGVCGSCQIKILEGAENLNELTSEELDLGMDRHKRLACRCSIQKGVVKVTY